MYSGTIAAVLNPVHRRKAYDEGIFLNIFQPKHDYFLSSVARRMRFARVIKDTFVNLSGLTIVVEDGKKTGIRSLEDLEKFAAAKERSIGEFIPKKVDVVNNCMDTS